MGQDVLMQDQDKVFDAATGNYAKTPTVAGKVYRSITATRGGWPGGRVSGRELGNDMWNRIPLKAAEADLQRCANDMEAAVQGYVDEELMELVSVDVTEVAITGAPAFLVHINDLSTQSAMNIPADREVK